MKNIETNISEKIYWNFGYQSLAVENFYSPIQIGATPQGEIIYDAVLLDGDWLIHQLWSLAAKKKGKKLIGFLNPDTLWSGLSLVNKNSIFFIDSNLGSVKGEEVALQLYEAGYINLYLATGYAPSYFGAMPWISGIRGKEPPWKLN